MWVSDDTVAATVADTSIQRPHEEFKSAAHVQFELELPNFGTI